MELKTLTDQFMEKIGIDSTANLPDVLMGAVLSGKVDVYEAYLEVFPDLSKDHLRQIWQFFESDRDELKQDYTAASIAKLIAKYTNGSKTTYDQCAGSGALTIAAWNLNKDAEFICEELDDRVIPILLFNLAVRNCNAIVINRDVLTQKDGKAWAVTKGRNKFSAVSELPWVPTINADASISNPPYNIKWSAAAVTSSPFYFGLPMPPNGNANAVFIINALAAAETKTAIILPASDTDAYSDIRDEIAGRGYLDAVITLPQGVFESTPVATMIMFFNKAKQDRMVTLIDHRERFETVIREQRGEKHMRARVYKKEVKVLTDEMIDSAIKAINDRETESEFCASVHEDELIGKSWSPGAYIGRVIEEPYRRSYKDITDDLLRIAEAKNDIKITINETLARQLGLYEVAMASKSGIESTKQINETSGKLVGFELPVNNYITLSKSAIIRIDARSDRWLPEPLMFLLNNWAQRQHYLNNEENRYMAELRDRLLPDLMSGELLVGESGGHDE